MPKGSRQTMGKSLEKPKRLTVRDATFFLLGGLAVVGSSHFLSSSQASEPKPATPVSSASVDGEKESESQEEWPDHLVPGIRFDRNPADYVDVDQCQKLVFMAPESNCESDSLTSEEILRKAEQIKEARFLMNQRMEALRNESELESEEEESETEDEVTEELASLFAEEDFEGVIEDYEVDSILDEAGEAGVEIYFAESVELIKATKELFSEAYGPEEKAKVAEQYINRLSSLSLAMPEQTRDQIQKNYPTLWKFWTFEGSRYYFNASMETIFVSNL